MDADATRQLLEALAPILSTWAARRLGVWLHGRQLRRCGILT